MKKRNALKLSFPNLLLGISILFVFSGHSIVLAETYQEAVKRAEAHAKAPAGWLPASSPGGPIVIIPDTSGTDQYGLKYDAGALIVRSATRQMFWIESSVTTKAPGQNYNIVGSHADNKITGGAWVTTGNDYTTFLDNNMGTLRGAEVTKLIERGLGMRNDDTHNAIVEYAVADLNNNAIRPTNYVNNSSYNTANPDDYKYTGIYSPFAKPAGMDQTTYDDFTRFLQNHINNSYDGSPFPFTNLGYTYFWDHNNGVTLEDIRGMSEFVIMPNQDRYGNAFGEPYGTVRVFGIYPTQSYIYTRNDGVNLSTAAGTQYGNGFASFNVTGPCDTVWAGHRFQSKIKRQAVDAVSNLITNSGTISGGQGILVWSRNYNFTNTGTISGATSNKFGRANTANIAVLFLGDTTAFSASVIPPSGAADINQLTNTGTISSPGIAIQADAGDTRITNNAGGVISGNTYAILTAAGNDTVTINGGEITGSVDLGTGIDVFTVTAGSNAKLNFYLNTDTVASAQIVNAETVTIADNTTLAVISVSGADNIRNNENFLIAESANLTVTPANLIIQDNSALAMITFAATSDATNLYLTAIRDNTYYAQGSGNASLGAVIDTLANSASQDMAVVIGALDNTNNPQNAQRLEPFAASPIINAVIESLNNFGSVFSTQMARLGNDEPGYEVYALKDGKRKRVSSAAVKDLLAYNSDSILENSFNRPENWEVFATGFGIIGFQSDRGGSIGYESSGGGTQFGFYRRVNDEAMLGFLGGYMYDGVQLNSNSGSQAVNSVRVGPCGKWLRGDLYATGAVTYGYHAVQADRKIVLGAVNRQADSDYSMHDISPYIETGYILRPRKNLEVVPNICLQYDWMHSQSYNESGAGAANLSVKAFNANSLVSVIGVRFNGRIDTGSVTWLPEFNAGWQHEYLGRLNDIKASFSSESAGTFTTNANAFDRSAVRAGVALNLIYGKKRNALSFQYNAQVYDSASNHVFSITCRNYF